MIPVRCKNKTIIFKTQEKLDAFEIAIAGHDFILRSLDGEIWDYEVVKEVENN